MTKLVALVLLGLPFIAVGGVLYKRAAKDTTWQEAMFKSYAVLQNVPGKPVFDCHAATTGSRSCALADLCVVSQVTQSTDVDSSDITKLVA